MHASGNFIRAHTDLVRQRALRGVILWQKFMQRRIEETNRGRSSFERLENTDEIPLLIRQQFRQRFLPVIHLARQDHFAHGIDAIALEKHVFSPAKTNAAGTESDRIFHLLWRVGVSPHTHAGDLGAQINQSTEIAIRLGLLRDLIPMEQSLNDSDGAFRNRSAYTV